MNCLSYHLLPAAEGDDEVAHDDDDFTRLLHEQVHCSVAGCCRMLQGVAGCCRVL